MKSRLFVVTVAASILVLFWFAAKDSIRIGEPPPYDPPIPPKLFVGRISEWHQDSPLVAGDVTNLKSDCANVIAQIRDKNGVSYVDVGSLKTNEVVHWAGMAHDIRLHSIPITSQPSVTFVCNQLPN
jgi:hypothetical protein